MAYLTDNLKNNYSAVLQSDTDKAFYKNVCRYIDFIVKTPVLTEILKKARTNKNETDWFFDWIKIKWNKCRSDVIGKHAALKMLWSQGREGPSPSSGTNKELIGFLEAKARDARSASQGFPPDFPNEFRNFGALARNVFSPRRRCEIRSNFDYFIYSICFDTKRIFVVEIFLL